MNCPKCGTVQTKQNCKVMTCNSIPESDSIRRRRRCECGYKYTTREYTSKVLEEQLILRDISIPNETADKSGGFVSCMIEDLKTALENAKKMEKILIKYQKNQRTGAVLVRLDGGKN